MKRSCAALRALFGILPLLAVHCTKTSDVAVHHDPKLRALSSELHTRPSAAAHAKASAAESCTYTVSLSQLEPARLSVDVGCRGFMPKAFRANDDASGAFVQNLRDDSGRAIPHRGQDWPLEDDHAHVQYEVDLEGLAQHARHFDVAERVGQSLVAATSSFLLSPVPATANVHVTVGVRTPPSVEFATALRQAGSGYELQAHEIAMASYSVFGKFRRSEFELPGRGSARSRIEIATLDAPLRLPPAELERWIAESARAVAEFWSGFPVSHALVVVRPAPRRESVVFGKVLPESSPGIALVVGERTPESALYRDWILVHELFHLGTPSFSGEGKWLDEGLATYYEPLIRARAGWYAEAELWSEFVHAMPQGLEAMTREGLENADDYRGIYWGGALLVLRADLEERLASHGARGLEHGLHALLDAGADATQVWPLADALETADAALDAPFLEQLSKRHAAQGASFDLNAIFARLGVRRQGARGVELSRDPEQVSLRRALVYGGPPLRTRR